MKLFFNLGLGLMIGMIFVLVVMPKVIPILHQLKFGQVEREEGLESHKSKSGTPTMGGVVFVVGAILAAFIANISNLNNPKFWIITIVLLGYSAIGFADDYLIVKLKSNEGLSPKLKFGLQALLAVICYWIASATIPGFDSTVTIPIFRVSINIGFLYPVLIFFMFTGTSNAVNISDGLDGLATGLMMIAVAPFIIFGLMGKDSVIATYGMAMIGALLGFIVFNYHPAKIFMGDVGSLGLGGFLAILAILTKQELLLIIVGGVFIMEALSVIIQVISFKTRGKRVFKMAPIHHHFELEGWKEQQVTITFWFAGFICGILAIILGVL